MATITLDVPDQLAQRLHMERDRLPQLLEQALQQRATRLIPTDSPDSAFAEMIQFLASQPTAEEILAFKISPQAQERLADLLEKNREEGLSGAENAELDWYEYVHEIMTRLKAETRSPSAG